MNENRISEELNRIQREVPKELIKKTVSEANLSPIHSQMVDEVLAKKDIDQNTRRRFEQIKASGEFDKKELVDNPKAQAELNRYMERKIDQAIKEGKLPPRDKARNLGFVRQINSKFRR